MEENDNKTLNNNELQNNEPSERNWEFFNNLQSVKPYESHGGNNQTPPTTKAFKKRRNKQKTQKNSRRINRKH